MFKRSPRNPQCGLSIMEVMIALAVVGISIVTVLKVSHQGMNGMAYVKAQQEKIMLRSYVKNSFSCQTTFATSPAVCASGGYISLKDAHGNVFIKEPDASGGYSLVNDRYALRAMCKGAEVNIGFAGYQSQGGKPGTETPAFAKNAFTGKLQEWSDLFNGVPLVCAEALAPPPAAAAAAPKTLPAVVNCNTAHSYAEALALPDMASVSLATAKPVFSYTDFDGVSDAYRLEQDVDLSGMTGQVRVGKILYGQNHRLYGYNGDFGLFSFPQYMLLQDLTIANVTIKNTNNSIVLSTSNAAGVIAGTITGCLFMRNVEVANSSVTTTGHAGAIAGVAAGTGSFEGVSVHDISLNNPNYHTFWGISIMGSLFGIAGHIPGYEAIPLVNIQLNGYPCTETAPRLGNDYVGTTGVDHC